MAVIVKELNGDQEEVEFLSQQSEFRRNVQKEREKYEPTPREKIFAVAKSLVLRALLVFFLAWLLRPMMSKTGKTEL